MTFAERDNSHSIGRQDDFASGVLASEEVLASGQTAHALLLPGMVEEEENFATGVLAAGDFDAVRGAGERLDIRFPQNSIDHGRGVCRAEMGAEIKSGAVA